MKQAKQLPQVRVVRSFMDGCHAYNVGDLVRPGGVTRDIWSARGLIELIKVDAEDNTVRPQTATVQVKRKRGRPRKVRESAL